MCIPISSASEILVLRWHYQMQVSLVFAHPPAFRSEIKLFSPAATSGFATRLSAASTGSIQYNKSC